MKAQIAIPETFLHDIDIEALGYKYFDISLCQYHPIIIDN